MRRYEIMCLCAIQTWHSIVKQDLCKHPKESGVWSIEWFALPLSMPNVSYLCHCLCKCRANKIMNMIPRCTQISRIANYEKVLPLTYECGDNALWSVMCERYPAMTLCISFRSQAVSIIVVAANEHLNLRVFKFRYKRSRSCGPCIGTAHAGNAHSAFCLDMVIMKVLDSLSRIK
jgi:hypothetical protein